VDRKFVAAGKGSVETAERVWLAQVSVKVEFQSLDSGVMDDESEGSKPYLGQNLDQVLA